MASPSVTIVTERVPGNFPTAIQQVVTAGNLFNGTLPQATGPVRADSPLDAGKSIYKYAPAAAGGLFFWNTKEALICSQIIADLGATGDITISLVNLDPAHINDDSPTILAGEEIIVFQDTGLRYVALEESKLKLIILPLQAIKVVTANTAQAQKVQVFASLERTFMR